ncbi:MAG: cbb3-type cytochrome oxidase assembly protein CcoS [Thermoanaerobaculia bacterium]|jgi:hypothetical protein
MDNLTVSTIAFYSALALGFLALAAAFVGSVRSGAMRDDESPKYRMLEDDGGHDVRE